MNKQEVTHSKEYTRIYNTLPAKLHIVDIYESKSGHIYMYVCRWNPLFWMFALLNLIFIPLYCYISGYNIGEEFRYFKKVIKTGEI